MTAAVLGLGANLGDPRHALAAAVRALGAHPEVEVTSVSSLWRTAPVGGPEQPDYLNAALLLETTLDPSQLLALAQELEATAGRVRDVRWGPRTLDVDILDVAGVTSSEAALTIPHPRAHQRAFVLAPWAQIAPDWTLAPTSELRRTVEDWAVDVVGEVAPGDLACIEGGAWWR